MSVALDIRDRLMLTVRRPLAGLTVARFSGDRPLMRAIPAHYGTTLHLGGHSRWTSDGSEWSTAPGSLGVKVPGEVCIERAREGAPACQIVLFDTTLIDEAHAALDRPILEPRTLGVDARDPRARPLLALHRRLLDEESGAALEETMVDALHAMVDVLVAPHGTDSGRTTGFTAAVKRARALLDERFTETIGLDALAAHARLDKFRLCRAFSEQVGLPPHAYVTHRRIARAQHLLARGMSQAEVAASVGFYDQSLMHRHFKRILHITPGAFARAAQG
jgi:AraC-like DNA-binding protein